jgi:mannose-6-phosphate isomerase-like protein (cupin superfamily)
MHVQQSTFVPAGALHRIDNPGRSPLVIIEVQNGRYLGEDDIIRVEDDYDRIKPMGSLPPSKGAAE